jgi:hypothetical protein
VSSVLGGESHCFWAKLTVSNRFCMRVSNIKNTRIINLGVEEAKGVYVTASEFARLPCTFCLGHIFPTLQMYSIISFIEPRRMSLRHSRYLQSSICSARRSFWYLPNANGNSHRQLFTPKSPDPSKYNPSRFLLAPTAQSSRPPHPATQAQKLQVRHPPFSQLPPSRRLC